MMRCEVCGHKIPIGQKMCPNCGFRLDKDPIVVEEASIHQEDYIPQYKKSDIFDKIGVSLIKSRAGNVHRRMRLIITMWVLAIFIICVQFISFGTSTDRKDDKYLTLETAERYRDEIVNELEELNMEFIYTDEEINSYKDGLEAKYLVTGNYNYNDFTVGFTYRLGSKEEFYFMTGDEIGGDLEEFPILDVDLFSHIMGYDSLVAELDAIREYNPKIGFEYEDDRIIAFERYDDNDDIYNIHYQIAGKGYVLEK